MVTVKVAVNVITCVARWAWGFPPSVPFRWAVSLEPVPTFAVTQGPAWTCGQTNHRPHTPQPAHWSRWREGFQPQRAETEDP